MNEKLDRSYLMIHGKDLQKLLYGIGLSYIIDINKIKPEMNIKISNAIIVWLFNQRSYYKSVRDYSMWDDYDRESMSYDIFEYDNQLVINQEYHHSGLCKSLVEKENRTYIILDFFKPDINIEYKTLKDFVKE